MNHLTRNDYARALTLLASLEPTSFDPDAFARAVVEALGDFVASELVTLSVCDLATGHREGVEVEQAVAVPLFMDGRSLVSLVFNRRAMDFSERDCERLELLRPHLAFLYRNACRTGLRDAREAGAPPPRLLPFEPLPRPADLTARECDVLQWLAAGKTDADIAALLSISVRTVQKHLEHIYVKLGVETRTAAVMRALGMCRPRAGAKPIIECSIKSSS